VESEPMDRLEFAATLADLSYKAIDKPLEFKVKTRAAIPLDDLADCFGGVVTITITRATIQAELPFEAEPDPGPHEFRAVLTDEDELTEDTPLCDLSQAAAGAWARAVDRSRGVSGSTARTPPSQLRRRARSHRDRDDAARAAATRRRARRLMPRTETQCFCPTCGEDVDPNPEGRCPRCGHIVMGGGVLGRLPAPLPVPNGKAAQSIADELEGIITRGTAQRVHLLVERERIDAQVREIDSLLKPLVQALATARGQKSARSGPKAGMPLNGRWARDWDACQGCGSTEKKHASHGLCYTCNDRRKAGQPLPLEVAS
jgi:hypothetical protein